MFLSFSKAGIYRGVLIHDVDLNGKFKPNGVSNDILKIQNVDGLTLYDASALSFNAIHKASKLKLIMLISYNL